MTHFYNCSMHVLVHEVLSLCMVQSLLLQLSSAASLWQGTGVAGQHREGKEPSVGAGLV